MGQSNTKKKPNIEQGQYVKCRGNVWRVIGERDGFVELELLKEGLSFSETQERVWMIPDLEVNTLEVLSNDSFLAEDPKKNQLFEGKLAGTYILNKSENVTENVRGSSEASVGRFCGIDYKEWQFEPWNRLATQLFFPRILIADDVGLGKTSEAAIILAELTKRKRADRVLIITPQHLTDKWQDELYERFGLPFEIYNRDTRARLSDRGVINPWNVVEKVIVSRDFVKRWENLKALEKVSWDMVVIDECHHFVKDNAQAPTRLRDLAEKIVYNSPGLILLSATPFTGSDAEFHSLLSLVDPKYSDSKHANTWDSKNPYLVRRLKSDVQKAGEVFPERKIIDLVMEYADLGVKEKSLIDKVTRVFDQKSAAKDESGLAEKLLLETARKRLSSSWHAFSMTVSNSPAIRAWFDDNLVTEISNFAAGESSAKYERLYKYLKEITNETKSKVVIFTESIDTQEAVAQYLVQKGRLAGSAVACINSKTATSDRLDIEDNFANAESDLVVLIATDSISEGKDLQHACHHLIHFELPWSFVKIEQRNGRIDRLGQNSTPTVAYLVYDTPATPDQRILARLKDKLDLAKKKLGSVSPIVAALEDIRDFSQGEAKIEEKIAETTKNAEDFGLSEKDTNKITPASASASLKLKLSDDTRIASFKLMITSLKGSLTQYGSTSDQYVISLPEQNSWEFPGLLEIGESSPDGWRITFNPKTFLGYEKNRRKYGEDRNPLRFISPVHPLFMQVELRFRNLLEQNGYPVFISNSIKSDLLLVEYSARSSSSRIVEQKLVAYDLSTKVEVSLEELKKFTPASGAKLEETNKVSKFKSYLEQEKVKYSSEISARYKETSRLLNVEQSQIEAKVGSDKKAILARQGWIDSLWTIGEDQTTYQIIAYIQKKG